MRSELDGNNAEQVHVEDDLIPGGFSISPDGKYILYSRDDGLRKSTDSSHEVTVRKAFVCDLANGTAYPVFPLPPDINSEYLNWMPNGSHICYKYFKWNDDVFRDSIRIVDFDFETIKNDANGTLHIHKNDPSAIILNAPYPNPFNPATTIEFTIPTASDVSLSVYSVSGQKEASLVDCHMMVGRHSFVFDGSDLASGMHFYRLEAGETVKKGKMMLLK